MRCRLTPMFNDYLFMSNPNHNMCSHWGVVGPEKINILKDIENIRLKRISELTNSIVKNSKSKSLILPENPILLVKGCPVIVDPHHVY